MSGSIVEKVLDHENHLSSKAFWAKIFFGKTWKSFTLPSFILNVQSFNRRELNVGIDLVCSNELHQDQCFTNKVFIQYKENSELVSISMEVAEKLWQGKWVISVILPIKIEVISLLMRDYYG